VTEKKKKKEKEETKKNINKVTKGTNFIA